MTKEQKEHERRIKMICDLIVQKHRTTLILAQIVPTEMFELIATEDVKFARDQAFAIVGGLAEMPEGRF